MQSRQGREVWQALTVGARMTVKNECKSISPYLIDGIQTIVMPSDKPFAPKQIEIGNFALDDGNLIVTQDEYADMVKAVPEIVPFLKRFIGGRELLYGESRWCLWLDGADEGLLNNPFLAPRFKRCRDFRLSSTRESTKRAAKSPHLFAEWKPLDDHPMVLIPRVSSEKRRYIPVDCVHGAVASDAVYVIRNAGLDDFGVLSSLMHMAWIKTAASRLESRYRYSRNVCYNAFPWPEMNDNDRKQIAELSNAILAERRKIGKSLAEMYDPDRMPDCLRKAHEKLDFAVEKLYRPDGFRTDADRLSCLLRMYAEASEKSSGISQKSVDFFF